MATIKRRLNITLPFEVESALKRVSLKDKVPQATKAIELIKLALETEEDLYFVEVSEKRLKEKAKFIDHKSAWK